MNSCEPKRNQTEDESFFERVARHIDLDTRSAKRQTAHRGHVGHADCSSKNHTAFAQEVYGHAVRTVVAALQPLAMQINIFKAERARCTGQAELA